MPALVRKPATTQGVDADTLAQRHGLHRPCVAAWTQRDRSFDRLVRFTCACQRGICEAILDQATRHGVKRGESRLSGGALCSWCGSQRHGARETVQGGADAVMMGSLPGAGSGSRQSRASADARAMLPLYCGVTRGSQSFLAGVMRVPRYSVAVVGPMALVSSWLANILRDQKK